jgi:hypothetical protein
VSLALLSRRLEFPRVVIIFITASYIFGDSKVKQDTLNVQSIKLFAATGENDGIPRSGSSHGGSDSKITAVVWLIVLLDNVGGDDDSTGGETVDASQVARDVYFGFALH